MSGNGSDDKRKRRACAVRRIYDTATGHRQRINQRGIFLLQPDCSGFQPGGFHKSLKKKFQLVRLVLDALQKLSHDSKWTAEAVFNLLDNAVKYTPVGGAIRISVEQWEMYVKLSVSALYYLAGSIMENSEPLPGSETTLI